MTEKLEEFTRQLEDIDRQLSSADTMKDMKKYTFLTQERSRIAPVVESLTRLKDILEQIDETRELLKTETDSEMAELARQELADLETACQEEEKKAALVGSRALGRCSDASGTWFPCWCSSSWPSPLGWSSDSTCRIRFDTPRRGRVSS